MEIISLYYFSEVAKDRHITDTANRLHITQQTLSNHILRLEREFGAQLFNRKPVMSLTYAGEFVLAFAETVLKEQTNLSDILSDVARSERGVWPPSSRRSSAAIRTWSCAFPASSRRRWRRWCAAASSTSPSSPRTRPTPSWCRTT